MTKALHRPDDELETAVVDHLLWTPDMNSAHIGVSVNDGAVTLSGEVDSYPKSRLAGKVVERVHGVTAIAQEITVNSTWIGVPDIDIAREASEAVQRAVDVPDTVRVSVHDHVVTLPGSVLWHDEHEAADRAVHYLKGVKGVLNNIQIRPTASAANIKAGIAAALVRDARLDGQHITVTTDTAGVVTLDPLRGHPGSRRSAHTRPGTTTTRRHIMSSRQAPDGPVVVTVSPEGAPLDAVWWAADYARHRGLPLRLVTTFPSSSSPADLVRTRYSDVVVQTVSTANPLIDALLDESQSAHLVVVGHQPRNDVLVTSLSARARCPVVALPRGVEWNEPVRPVVVGMHGGERSPAVLAFAFAEADRLRAGVRVVRCAPGHVTGDAVAEAIARVAAWHPDVPVQVEGSDCSPARALTWHAHFGSMVVVGSRGRGRVLGALFGSVSQGVLRHASGPVVVIGPHAIAAYQSHQAVPDFDTTRG